MLGPILLALAGVLVALTCALVVSSGDKNNDKD